MISTEHKCKNDIGVSSQSINKYIRNLWYKEVQGTSSLAEWENRW